MPKGVHIRYLNARDKICSTWENFEDTVEDSHKPYYRELIFQYLIDCYNGWIKFGDCLPTQYMEYTLRKARE